MRGLIYKEFTVFCKCIDKKLILIAAAFSLLLLCKAGYYGGLMASVLLAMTVGMQNVMSFVSDDKARWQKYQMALPMSDMSVVASKYISVLCTLGISLLGAGALNLASSVLYRNFDPVVWGLGVFAAVFLPLTYWFGVQSAQVMGMLIVIPVFYFIKYFEDGSGFSAMAASLSSYLFLAGAVTVAAFGASLLISAAGYARRREQLRQ